MHAFPHTTLNKPLKKLTILLALIAMVLGNASDFTAEAAKKKVVEAAPDPAIQAEAELKKSLEPLSTQLTKLMTKIQSRALLSPNEAGQLVELKYKLLDVMDQYPQNALLAKPVYQAGMLFSDREEYNDAYELFNYLAQAFPSNPYGAKAKGQVQQLEKQFGPGFFSVESSAAAASTLAATPTEAPKTPAATTPAKK